ncbi:Epiplakin [Tupaia chinensis]|uniref:Epiplakin n=1 Tax=Tupaia chinensis TaxID=246437 RepID=L9KKX9_TUPCH|nr:Epiplakin [Tupaia chinensis]
MLLDAEKAARGYSDPDTGEPLPLLLAMDKKLVSREDALRLLEVQVATGGVIDPRHHHRLPLQTAYRRGCLHEDVYALVSDQKHMKKRFVDPNTQDRVTYQELQQRCRREAGTGWALFPVLKDTRDSEYIEEATQRALEVEQVEVTAGRYRGQKLSLWSLLNSEYVTEEKRRELVRRYRTDTVAALQDVAQAVLRMIEEEERAGRQLWFPGIRRQVTAAELVSSAVITRETLRDLKEGKKTVRQVAEESEVQRYLQGTSCIAGVLVPAKDGSGGQEKMSIYQAMWKGVLRPGTALVLLEAQAATGFVVDPVGDRRLSVEEAVAAGVVGGEIQEKLLETLRDLKEGKKTVRQVAEMDSVQRYLQGTSCIAGVLVPAKDGSGGQEKMSIYQAMWKGVLRPGTALVLLEAQAATGFVVDPVGDRRLSVEEAVAAGVIQEKLLSSERPVTGYTDPYTGERISLFQAMQRDLIVREHGIRLLEAQIATGGVIDPVPSHRVPVEVAYQRGYFDEEMSRVLADPGDDTKGFFDPNTHENLTYLQLLRRCVRDPETGLYMLQLAGRGSAVHQLSEESRRALHDARVTPGSGPLRAQSVSVWELLFYREVPESRRQDLLRQYQAGTLTAQEVGAALATLLARAEEDAGPRPDPRGALRAATMEVKVGRLRGPAVPVWDVLASSYGQGQGQGEPEGEAQDARGGQEQALRAATLEVRSGLFGGRPVSAWDVLFSAYVSEARRDELLAQHAAGALALPELAAILTRVVEDTEERLSKVSFRGLRRQVSASELRTSGILGPETLRDLAQGTKTLQEVAEMDSVQRYLQGTSCIAGVLVPAKDGSGGQEKMSIYQAMWKGVLRPGTALVLLEAQAATGFVVDPVGDRRLSVEEAVAAGVRGYFDEEMSRVLADPGDDTKGFFDPNTHENLTYLQLLRRCVRDPETGLYMLQLAGRGSAVHQLSEESRRALHDARVTPGSGPLRAQSVSVWELLFYREVPESRRQDLLRQYQAGTLTAQEVGAALAALLARAEEDRRCV